MTFALPICGVIPKEFRPSKQAVYDMLDSNKDKFKVIFLGGRYYVDDIIREWTFEKSKLTELHFIQPNKKKFGQWAWYERNKALAAVASVGLVISASDRLSKYTLKCMKEDNKELVFL